LLSNDLNRALLQQQDEMSKPGEPGGVMVRMAAVLALKVCDPLALLDLACPQQAREPTRVEPMSRSGFVVWRPHIGSPRAGQDEATAGLPGAPRARVTPKTCPAGVADRQHRLGSVGLPPAPGIPSHHPLGHEQSR